MFDKNTTLSQLSKDPKAKKILVKFNLPCLTCPFAGAEMEELKIGKICEMYGINIDNLLRDLNEQGNKKLGK
ncbi:MAG: DUF1858 domain-containing protein [Candidatus Nealsonbacteria bacterium]